MHSMFDRHKVWTLYNTGEYSQRAIAKTLGIGRTTVQRILAEPAVVASDIENESAVRKGRGIGRPSLSQDLVAQLIRSIEREPRLTGREAMRRLREERRRISDATFIACGAKRVARLRSRSQ
jgi:transposase